MTQSASSERFALRSPLARAVVPVLGGIAFIAVLGLLTWAIAAYQTSHTPERLAPTEFTVGSAKSTAEIVQRDGPIVLPGLNTTTGERTIVLDHQGDDPLTGWRVLLAYPADAEPSCGVEQVVGTSKFIDCDGRTIDVDALAPPPDGVNPRVEQQRTLVIDLSGI